MKKIMILFLVIPFVLSLSSCRALREKLLSPPDEMEIPEGSSVAVCIVDEVEYKHIYQNDGIYQYFIDGVLQDDDVLNTIQEQAFLHGESVLNYLIDEYGSDGCTITDYDKLYERH